MQSLLNYPSDTNRLVFQAAPASELNSSQAALNASIKLIAGLVPYTGATGPVDLNSQNLACGSLSVAGTSAPVATFSSTVQGGGTNSNFTFQADFQNWVGNPQFCLQGKSDPNYQVLFGIDTVNGYGLLLALEQGSGMLPLVLNPGGTATRVLVCPTVADGSASVPGAIITTTTATFQVYGTTALDSGAITTDGLGTLCLHPQASPPAAVAGGIYFDGINFNFCADGSTWVALTLP